MAWAYFSRERVLKIRLPTSLSSHLSSSPMGVFSRDYGTYLRQSNQSLGFQVISSSVISSPVISDTQNQASLQRGLRMRLAQSRN